MVGDISAGDGKISNLFYSVVLIDAHPPDFNIDEL